MPGRSRRCLRKRRQYCCLLRLAPAASCRKLSLCVTRSQSERSGTATSVQYPGEVGGRHSSPACRGSFQLQLSRRRKSTSQAILPRLRSHCAAAMRQRGFPRQPARKRGRALLCAVCFFAAILTLWLVSWLYMGYVVAGEHVVEKPAEKNDARDLGAQQLLKSARQFHSESTSGHITINTTAAALRCVGQMAGCLPLPRF